MVGKEMLRVLEESSLPVEELRLWASDRSAGEKLQFRGQSLTVELLEPSAFLAGRAHYSLYATSANLSAEYAPLAASRGAICIDNSSHFRMNPDVPLVVPEVNPLSIHEGMKSGIIANPNCSTIQLVVCLKPIHDRAKLRRVIVSSYQSVSGAGAEAIKEFEEQARQSVNGEAYESKVFTKKIAFNCIPHIDVFQANGMTKEEMKIILESRKILGIPDLRITATAVRVPVKVGHAESVNVETERPLTVLEMQELLAKAPGVIVVDKPSELHYPTPQECVGKNEVFVGRIRTDESAPNSMHLWVVADNLRKGAATNAVQIAEYCIVHSLSRRDD